VVPAPVATARPVRAAVRPATSVPRAGQAASAPITAAVVAAAVAPPRRERERPEKKRSTRPKPEERERGNWRWDRNPDDE